MCDVTHHRAFVLLFESLHSSHILAAIIDSDVSGTTDASSGGGRGPLGCGLWGEAPAPLELMASALLGCEFRAGGPVGREAILHRLAGRQVQCGPGEQLSVRCF